MNKIMLFMLIVSSLNIAQSREYSKENWSGIGAMVGYSNAADAEGGSFIGGVVGRMKFIDLLGAELNVTYKKEDYLLGAVSVTNWPITISGMIYPTDFLYGLAGIGLYNISVDYPNFSLFGFNAKDFTVSKVGYHLGAGVTFPLGMGFRIFGDGRYHFLKYNLANVVGVDFINVDVNANFYSLNLGLLYTF